MASPCNAATKRLKGLDALLELQILLPIVPFKAALEQQAARNHQKAAEKRLSKKGALARPALLSRAPHKPRDSLRSSKLMGSAESSPAKRVAADQEQQQQGEKRRGLEGEQQQQHAGATSSQQQQQHAGTKMQVERDDGREEAGGPHSLWCQRSGERGGGVVGRLNARASRCKTTRSPECVRTHTTSPHTKRNTNNRGLPLL